MQENEEMQESLERPNSSQNFSSNGHGRLLFWAFIVFLWSPIFFLMG